VAPEVIVEGAMETVFPYIPVHMEYIFFELLKNSLRATVEFCESSKLTAPPS